MFGFTCEDFGDGPPGPDDTTTTVFVVATNFRDEIYFQGSVRVGQGVPLSGGPNTSDRITAPAMITVYADESRSNPPLQDIEVNLSCSSSISRFDQYGGFLLECFVPTS